MWLIRFHLIETRDYNYANRICRKMGIAPKRTSDIVLIKALLLHVFQKKSWRTVALEVGISHVTAFQFYNDVRDTAEFHEILSYFIERRIVLSILHEKNITREYLESDEILQKSLELLPFLIKSL